MDSGEVAYCNRLIDNFMQSCPKDLPTIKEREKDAEGEKEKENETETEKEGYDRVAALRREKMEMEARTLMLSNARIRKVGVDTLTQKLSEIGKFILCLDLSNNRLTELSPIFSAITFPFIKKLNLRSNQFRQFPEEISTLTTLTELRLSNNGLFGMLSPLIGKLTNLITLDLSFNSLTDLPPEVCPTSPPPNNISHASLNN